jgi:hypothetical protein
MIDEIVDPNNETKILPILKHCIGLKVYSHTSKKEVVLAPAHDYQGMVEKEGRCMQHYTIFMRYKQQEKENL